MVVNPGEIDSQKLIVERTKLQSEFVGKLDVTGGMLVGVLVVGGAVITGVDLGVVVVPGVAAGARTFPAEVQNPCRP
jgi:hypothetical protein